jgi:hypothetical protein
MVVSATLAAVTTAVSGSPPPSQTRWSLDPGLPRSTGLRPHGPPTLGPHAQAALIFAEKALPAGQRTARFAAAALIGYGLLVLAMPTALPLSA